MGVAFCCAVYARGRLAHLTRQEGSIKMPVPQSEHGEEQAPSASWADRMEDLDASKITPDNLPEQTVTIDGDTKTVVSYKVQDGKVKRIISVFQIERHRVPKSVARRKEWKKFGDAIHDRRTLDGRPDPATTQVVDEVFLALTTNKETLEQQTDDPLKKLKEQSKGMVTCRICKGDHWTSKCPYKDTLGPATIKELEEQVTPKPDVAAAPPMAASGSGKYIPPSQRGEGKKGESMSQSRLNDDQTTVRVTNLSEDAQEADLRDLFGFFGQIRRIFLAKDKITQQSKGFAFISFMSRQDAQKAIESLDGFGYDHLILKVEWAKPSKVH